MLKELELWDIVGASDTITVPTYVVLKITFDKEDTKAQTLYLDSIKYHVIPHITGKSHAFDIWKALCTLYQSKN